MFERFLVVVISLMLLCLARLATIRTQRKTLNRLDAEADARMEAAGVDLDPFSDVSSGVRIAILGGLKR